jgi:serine protease Do
VKRTLYHILGVDSKASFEEIRLAYQTRLHELTSTPTSDPNALGLLREAYYTLSRPTSRSSYDSSLLDAVQPVTRPRVDGDAPSTRLGRILLCGMVLVVTGVGWTLWSFTRSRPQLSASAGALPSPVSEKVMAPTEPDPSSSISASGAALDAARSTRSAEDIFSDVSRSIARVVAIDRFGQQQSQGSGVVIAHGTVITNCHVVAHAGTITARVGSDTYQATVLVADEELDLCSLSVPGLSAPAVEIGSVRALRTGQRVYAIGAPRGLDLTMSEGIVSSLREVPAGTLVQTTAATSPGSSGGGLFNLSGQLVGIVTSQNPTGQNLNFAHPADWIAQMRARASSLKVATPSPPPFNPGPTTQQFPRVSSSPDALIVGSWWCLGGTSFPNGEFDFRSDGAFTGTFRHRVDSGTYSVRGSKLVKFDIRDRSFLLVIQDLTATRLVLNETDYSAALACDRK